MVISDPDLGERLQGVRTQAITLRASGLTEVADAFDQRVAARQGRRKLFDAEAYEKQRRERAVGYAKTALLRSVADAVIDSKETVTLLVNVGLDKWLPGSDLRDSYYPHIVDAVKEALGINSVKKPEAVLLAEDERMDLAREMYHSGSLGYIQSIEEIAVTIRAESSRIVIRLNDSVYHLEQVRSNHPAYISTEILRLRRMPAKSTGTE